MDRCAFLAWNLSQRGSRIRFCTQDVDWQLPEEADVYTILKYLAIVSPRQGRRLAASQDRNVFQIVFSASPERLAEAGWELGGSNMRLLTPEPESVGCAGWARNKTHERSQSMQGMLSWVAAGSRADMARIRGGAGAGGGSRLAAGESE